ncbi:unannotated protein [freshwater metagenome]
MFIDIPMTSAALGTAVKVETLDGEQEVSIKAGSSSGTVVHLKGLGITRLRGGGRGDLHVHVEIATPSKLDKAQEELLKTLAKARGEKLDDVKIHRSGDRHESSVFSRFKDAFSR